jgi:hypothetical protein
VFVPWRKTANLPAAVGRINISFQICPRRWRSKASLVLIGSPLNPFYSVVWIILVSDWDFVVSRGSTLPEKV